MPPSLYEGFGMPVTEAMACGTDCIVSESSSLIEISAGLVPMIGIKDVKAWAEAMEGKLEESFSTARREELIAHARSYTWERTAQAARSAIKYINMV